MRYHDIPWSEANCQNTDTMAWFPEKGTVTDNHLGILQRICNVCEIQQKCLAWAHQEGERGFWGGQYFAQRMEKDDVDDPEGVHTAGDGANVPDVWEGSEGEMRPEDW